MKQYVYSFGKTTDGDGKMKNTLGGKGAGLAEMALAHTLTNAVEAAYRRGDMLDKRRRMMEEWAKFCATPSAAKADGVVLPLSAASGAR